MGYTTTPINLLLTIWHKRLRHLNLPALRKHLQELYILFYNDLKDGLLCDSCQQAKATKIYNRTPQER